MRISDWSSDVCSSDLHLSSLRPLQPSPTPPCRRCGPSLSTCPVFDFRPGLGPRLHLPRTSPAPDARHAADVPAIGRLPVHRALATCSHNPSRRLPAAGQRPPHPMPAASDPCASGQTQSRSEEHTTELQSLMRISNAVFCLKKKTKNITQHKKT